MAQVTPSDEKATKYVVQETTPVRQDSFIPPSFSINDIKRSMVREVGGDESKLNAKQLDMIEHLRKLDDNGDGTIGIMEIVEMEKNMEKTQSNAKRLKILILLMVLAFLGFMVCFLGMAVWAIEITKETRAEGGTSVAKPAKASIVPNSDTAARRRLGQHANNSDPLCFPGESQVHCDTRTNPTPSNGLARDGLRNFDGKAIEMLKEANVIALCQQCVTQLKEMRQLPAPANDIYPDEKDHSCTVCPACIEVSLDGQTVWAHPTSNCPLVTTYVQNGDTYEIQKRTVSKNIYEYGNNIENPISYNVNFLKFLRDQCLQIPKPDGTTKTEGECTAEQTNSILDSMPVIVNPNIRYVELSPCITAEVYESCSVATIFKGGEKIAINAKVSYDNSFNPTVCGKTTLEQVGEKVCHDHDTVNNNPKLFMNNDGSLTVDTAMAELLQKSFGGIIDDCLTGNSNKHEYHIQPNTLKVVMHCLKSPIQANEPGLSVGIDKHGPPAKIYDFIEENFPVGNEATQPSTATAILPPMGAQPNMPQMDEDSFYASFLTSTPYDGCNDDKVEKGYCYWENVTDPDSETVTGKIGMAHKEVTLINNVQNGLAIQKTVQKSDKKFGSASNPNHRPWLLEEKIEMFQTFPGSGCMEKDRYQAFVVYRFDLHRGGMPVGVDVDEGGYLLCKSSSAISGNDQAIPCGYPLEDLQGDRIRPELIDQFARMKEMNFDKLENRRLKERELKASNTIRSRSKIYDRMPQLFAGKKKMANQADQATLHFKRALGFNDVTNAILYQQQGTDDFLLELCENKVSDVDYARRLEFKLHSQGKSLKHLKRVSPIGHMIHATKRHLKDVHKKLKVIHKKLKAKHGRKLGYSEAVTEFKEQLFSIDDSLRNIRLNETTEDAILNSVFFGTGPETVANNQRETTGHLLVEYEIRKKNMMASKEKHAMAEEQLCMLQKSEATETDKGAWGKGFESAVGEEVRAEMEYQNAKAHFEEVVTHVETLYILQKYPEKVQNVLHIFDALESDVLKDYDDFLYSCSVNNDCTEEQKNEEYKKMKHISNTIDRLHKVVDSIIAIAIDAKKPASICEYIKFIKADNGHGWMYVHNIKYFDGEEQNLKPLMESLLPYMQRDTDSYDFIYPEEWSNAAEESIVSYQEEKEQNPVSDEEYKAKLLDKEEDLIATCKSSCLPTVVENNFLSYPPVSASLSCECAKYCSDVAKSYKGLRGSKRIEALEKMRKFRVNDEDTVCRVVSSGEFNVNAAILKNSQATRWRHATNNVLNVICDKNVDCYPFTDTEASYNMQNPNQGESRIHCADSTNTITPSYNKKVSIPRPYMKLTIQHSNHGGCLKHVESNGHVTMSSCDDEDTRQEWHVDVTNRLVKSSKKDVNGNDLCITATSGQVLRMHACDINDKNQKWDYNIITQQVQLYAYANPEFCLDYSDNTLRMQECCDYSECKRNQQWYSTESTKVSFPARKYSAKYERTGDTSPFEVRVEHGMFLDHESEGPLDKFCIGVDPNHKIHMGPATIHFEDDATERICATIDDYNNAGGGLFQHNFNTVTMHGELDKQMLYNIMGCEYETANNLCDNIPTENKKSSAVLMGAIGWDFHNDKPRIRMSAGKTIPNDSSDGSTEDGTFEVTFEQTFDPNIALRKACVTVKVVIQSQTINPDSGAASSFNQIWKSPGCDAINDACAIHNSQSKCEDSYGEDGTKMCQFNVVTKECYDSEAGFSNKIPDPEQIEPIFCSEGEVFCPADSMCKTIVGGNVETCKDKCHGHGGMKMQWSGDRNVCIQPSPETCAKEMTNSNVPYAYCDTKRCVSSDNGCAIDCKFGEPLKETMLLPAMGVCAEINANNCNKVGKSYCPSLGKCVNDCVTSCLNTVADITAGGQGQCMPATQELCKAHGYKFCDSNDYSALPECLLSSCDTCAGGENKYINSNSVCQNVPDCGIGTYCPLNKQCTSSCSDCYPSSNANGLWIHGWKDNETHTSGVLKGQTTCKPENSYMAGFYKCEHTGEYVEACNGMLSATHESKPCIDANGTFLHFAKNDTKTCVEATPSRCSSIGKKFCDKSTSFDGTNLTVTPLSSDWGAPGRRSCIDDCYHCYYKVANNLAADTLPAPTVFASMVYDDYIWVDKYQNLDNICLTVEMSIDYAEEENKVFCPPENLPMRGITPWRNTSSEGCAGCIGAKGNPREHVPSSGNGMCAMKPDQHCSIDTVECPLKSECLPRHNGGCFEGCRTTNNSKAYTVEKQEYEYYYDTLTNVHVSKTWFTCIEATEEVCQLKGKNFCDRDKTCRDNSEDGCQQCGGLFDPPGDPGSLAGAVYGDDGMPLTTCMNRTNFENRCALNGKFYCQTKGQNDKGVGRCVSSCSECDYAVTDATGAGENMVEYTSNGVGKCKLKVNCPPDTHKCPFDDKCYIDCDSCTNTFGVMAEFGDINGVPTCALPPKDHVCCNETFPDYKDPILSEIDHFKCNATKCVMPSITCHSCSNSDPQICYDNITFESELTLPAYGTENYIKLKDEYANWLMSEAALAGSVYGWHHEPSMGHTDGAFKDTFDHLYDNGYGDGDGCSNVCQVISNYRLRYATDHQEIMKTITKRTGFAYNIAENNIGNVIVEQNYDGVGYVDEHMLPGEAFCRFFNSDSYFKMAMTDCCACGGGSCRNTDTKYADGDQCGEFERDPVLCYTDYPGRRARGNLPNGGFDPQADCCVCTDLDITNTDSLEHMVHVNPVHGGARDMSAEPTFPSGTCAAATFNNDGAEEDTANIYSNYDNIKTNECGVDCTAWTIDVVNGTWNQGLGIPSVLSLCKENAFNNECGPEDVPTNFSRWHYASTMLAYSKANQRWEITRWDGSTATNKVYFYNKETHWLGELPKKTGWIRAPGITGTGAPNLNYQIGANNTCETAPCNLTDYRSCEEEAEYRKEQGAYGENPMEVGFWGCPDIYANDDYCDPWCLDIPQCVIGGGLFKNLDGGDCNLCHVASKEDGMCMGAWDLLDPSDTKICEDEACHYTDCGWSDTKCSSTSRRLSTEQRKANRFPNVIAGKQRMHKYLNDHRLHTAKKRKDKAKLKRRHLNGNKRHTQKLMKRNPHRSQYGLSHESHIKKSNTKRNRRR